MNDQPDRRQSMVEALELAGRGRDDFSDPSPTPLDIMLAAHPEFAELHRTSVRLDEMLGRAVRDVTVPEGLEERILSRLDEARSQRDAIASSPSRLPIGRSSRRWLVASVGVAAASLLLAALVGLGAFSRQYTADEILDEAVNQFIAGDNLPAGPVSAEVLASYPPSRDVRCLPNMRCRGLDNFLGCQAMAYKLTAWDGESGTLFVLSWKRPISGLDALPPDCPRPATGGAAAGAWQADGMVYVLVVQGDERVYRSFFEPARPLT
jgi:hypothetical protein